MRLLSGHSAIPISQANLMVIQFASDATLSLQGPDFLLNAYKARFKTIQHTISLVSEILEMYLFHAWAETWRRVWVGREKFVAYHIFQ